MPTPRSTREDRTPDFLLDGSIMTTSGSSNVLIVAPNLSPHIEADWYIAWFAFRLTQMVGAYSIINCRRYRQPLEGDPSPHELPNHDLSPSDERYKAVMKIRDSLLSETGGIPVDLSSYASAAVAAHDYVESIWLAVGEIGEKAVPLVLFVQGMDDATADALDLDMAIGAGCIANDEQAPDDDYLTASAGLAGRVVKAFQISRPDLRIREGVKGYALESADAVAWWLRRTWKGLYDPASEDSWRAPKLNCLLLTFRCSGLREEMLTIEDTGRWLAEGIKSLYVFRSIASEEEGNMAKAESKSMRSGEAHEEKGSSVPQESAVEALEAEVLSAEEVPATVGSAAEEKDEASGTEIPISSIEVGNRYRKDLGDLSDLMESIERVGLLHPIVVRPDRSLIAGQRRLESCRRLGWESIPIRVIDPIDTLMAEHDENVVRKPFLPSEAVAIKRALEPELKEEAKQRQRDAGKRGGSISGKGRTKQQGGENFSQPYPQKTRDAVSAVTGISHPSMRKAVAIVEAAEKEPEKFKSLVEEMDRTGRVDPVYRKLVKLQKRESEVEGVTQETPEEEASPPDDLSIPVQRPDPSPLPLPLRLTTVLPPPSPFGPKVLPSYEYAPAEMVPFIVDRFDVILINAPWEQLGIGGYPYVSGDAIKHYAPIQVLISQNCIVWLRATNSHMDDAFFTLRGWGIRPVSILTWVKPDAEEGEWLNEQTEHYIVAVHGNPPLRRDRLLNTVLIAPPKEGYYKPEEFYQLIEQMCDGQSRLEIFCEGPQEGWKSWTPQGMVDWFHEAYGEAGKAEEPQATEEPRTKKRK